MDYEFLVSSSHVSWHAEADCTQCLQHCEADRQCRPVSLFSSFSILQVFLLDPWSDSGVEMLEYVKLFMDHSVPARLGLVLLPDPQNEAALAICQGFAFISTKLSPREGLRWLIKVSGDFPLFSPLSLCYLHVSFSVFSVGIFTTPGSGAVSYPEQCNS